MMKITFGIPKSADELAYDILKSFLPEIQSDFDRSLMEIKKALPNLVYDIVTSSEEYDSLVSGRLKYDFGIPDASTQIAGLIRAWSTNILYDIKRPVLSGRKIIGGFSASLFKADFADVLGMVEAQVYDTMRGYSLPWLQWLVLDGRVPLVKNYHVELVNSARSRTKGALMRLGGNWGVPSAFAGTIANNWITRAIDSKSSSIDLLVEKAFQ